jgi:sugar phosphate permease
MVLAVGLLGLTAGSAAQYGLAVLIPALRTEGLSLETATLLVTAPIAGVLLTLIAWGAAADRWGERRILAIGLAFAGVAELAVSTVDGLLERWLLLFVVGASSASVHAASGRLILGWFAPSERGLAMGIRQMGQPLGVASAAIVLAPLAVSGVGNAFVALGIASLVAASLVGLVVRDPARPAHVDGSTSASPYRVPFLWRIHVASGFLVIAQYAITLFAFDYLVNVLGWSIAAAGALVAGTQLVGAASRLAVGWWSDMVRSRLGPMRLVALAIGIAMTILSVSVYLGTSLAVGALAVAAVVTVMPNGLAFTAVAERAGPRWAGRAMGIQNTFQNVFASIFATPLALLISAAGGGASGYALAFAAVVAFPFAAAALIPAASETPQV